jgi:hypothetical protein
MDVLTPAKTREKTAKLADRSTTIHGLPQLGFRAAKKHSEPVSAWDELPPDGRVPPPPRIYAAFMRE